MMAKFDRHPTVQWWRDRSATTQSQIVANTPLNSQALRELCYSPCIDCKLCVARTMKNGHDVDGSKAARELGVQPRSIEATFRDSVAWMRQHRSI